MGLALCPPGADVYLIPRSVSARARISIVPRETVPGTTPAAANISPTVGRVVSLRAVPVGSSFQDPVSSGAQNNDPVATPPVAYMTAPVVTVNVPKAPHHAGPINTPVLVRTTATKPKTASIIATAPTVAPVKVPVETKTVSSCCVVHPNPMPGAGRAAPAPIIPAVEETLAPVLLPNLMPVVAHPAQAPIRATLEEALALGPGEDV